METLLQHPSFFNGIREAKNFPLLRFLIFSQVFLGLPESPAGTCWPPADSSVVQEDPWLIASKEKPGKTRSSQGEPRKQRKNEEKQKPAKRSQEKPGKVKKSLDWEGGESSGSQEDSFRV
jgi:hypothetical protein